MMQLAIGSWRKFGGKQLMQPYISILLKFSVTKCHLLRKDDMEVHLDGRTRQRSGCVIVRLFLFFTFVQQKHFQCHNRSTFVIFSFSVLRWNVRGQRWNIKEKHASKTEEILRNQISLYWQLSIPQSNAEYIQYCVVLCMLYFHRKLI